MATLFEFSCACGYSTECSNGPDGTFFSDHVPMICGHCAEIRDVTVRRFEHEPGMNRGKATDITPVCPICDQGDLLSVWKTVGWWRPRPCPKCGKRMQKSRMLAVVD